MKFLVLSILSNNSFVNPLFPFFFYLELQKLEQEANKTTEGSGNSKDIFKWVENGDFEGVCSWLSSGDVAIVDDYSSIPLHIASLSGNADIVQILLDAKSDVNCVDDNLQTPLHLAAMKGHASVVQLLLDFEGDPNVYDAEDQSPLDWAAMLGHDAVMDILAPVTS